MTPPDPPGVTFLGDDGEELPPEDLDTDPESVRFERRRARVEQWLPDGGGAAVAALVLVLVAWVGATPLVQAATALFPQGLHSIGPLEDATANFGNGQYFGVTPGVIPVISFGTRGVVVVIALVLAFRARRREASTVATAAVATASVSLLLLLAGAVIMTIGYAHGHGGGFYGTPY